MRIIYEGVDITSDVDVAQAVYTDASGERMDGLRVAFEHAAVWYRWKPQEGERIEIKGDNGFSTGELYLHAIEPEDGRFMITAYSAKNAGRDRRWQSFENATLKTLVDACAAECGMSGAVYGINENLTYPYIIRNNETPLHFLRRIAILEGAALKCVNGKLAVIGIEYAQNLQNRRQMYLSAREQRPRYKSFAGKKLAGAIFVCTNGQAVAYDTSVTGGRAFINADNGACDTEQAKRWAKGWLLTHNRQCERMTICTSMDGSLTALTPIEISGDDPLAGNWLVDEVTHDLKRKTTEVSLVRSVTTII